MFITTVFVFISTFVGIYVSLFFLLTFFTQKERTVRITSYPKVTIAIPFYNEDPDVLQKTVDSVLNLDYPKDKLEVMLINDGSTNDTPQYAERYASKGVVYLSKSNGGKGSCLNLALEKSTGEFFGCLDVDSIVAPDALKKMMPYFRKKVMAVTPSLKIMQPRSVLERVQMIEFMLGVYLRKVFAQLDAVHVTPGPFTIFRKSFFTKYGSYDESTLTEDIEVALRIQHHDYEIENCIDANVYTYGIEKFKELQRQRLRWYKGFLDNVIRYRSLFSLKKKHLGMFILPMSFISVALIIIVSFLSIIEMGISVSRFTKNLAAVDWDITSLLLWNFEIFYIDLNTLVLLSALVFCLGVTTLYLSKRHSCEPQPMKLSFLFFILIYSFLFAYWWVLAIYHKVSGRPIYWGGRAFV